YDDPGLQKLRKCLEKFPDLVFIGHGPGFWAEFGTLRAPEDRFGYIQYPIDDEGMIPKLMREYPNLYVDLSATSGLTAIRRDVNYTVRFFAEFPTRILFGTDICYADQYAGQPAFMNSLLDENKISESLYDLIARENAERLLKLK
ncbi:MAG: amidohydrolase family protein, partial [Clostridia bacterium]|nr:amidohydrolase family protein [Clostridia bacterium]